MNFFILERRVLRSIPRYLCRLAAIAMLGLEDHLYILVFHLFQGFVLPTGGLHEGDCRTDTVVEQIVELDLILFGENDRALNCVLQFADIAGPFVFHQSFLGSGRNLCNVFSGFHIVLGDKVVE